MNPCDHWQDLKHPEGGYCELFGQTLSIGYCRVICKFNTRPGEWPPEKLPGKRSAANAKCGKCGGNKKKVDGNA